MADEIAPNATPAVAPEATPASPTPVETPVVPADAAPTPAVVEPSEAKPAKVAPDAAPAEESPLLTPDEPKKEETKPADAEKPVEGKKKDGEAQSDEPAPLPTYETFVFPEGSTFDEAKLSDFTNQLGEFEHTTKASHEEVQKLGQALIDRHISGVEEAITRHTEALVNEWNERKKGWVEKFNSDPEIGGNRKETSLREAKEFIKTHGGKQGDVDAFYKALQDTGADSHPDVVRFILNVKNSSTFRTPQPLVAQKPVPEVKSKIAKRYGGTA